jgi:uncharacterized protein YndB with AHSA1/START domain
MTAKNNDLLRELTLVRILDAPRELVFKLWTEPKHLAQWWGPKGFTNPVCELEARAGSAIRVHMRGPDGMVYPMGGEIREIVAPERLVFTTTAFEESGKEPNLINLNTVTFEESNGKTKLTLYVRVIKAGPGMEHALGGMDQGWSESFERLLDLAAATSGSEDRHIVATRLLDAPREIVWDAWIDPKQIALWWGPKGFTNTIEKMDVRPGGIWKFVMHGPDGTNYPNESTFVEIVKPQLFVFDHNSAPHFRFCATFIAEGEQTRVTVRMLFPSAEVREAIAKARHAVEGLSQTLGHLADHVSAKAKR